MTLGPSLEFKIASPFAKSIALPPPIAIIANLNILDILSSLATLSRYS